MRRLPILALLLLSMIPARGDDELVLALKYTKPAEMLRILKAVATQTGAKIEITAQNQNITLRGGDEEFRKRMADVVAEVDVPHVHVPTRFIKLHHASAEKAAEFLNKALAPDPPAKSDAAAKPGEDIPIQVVPATRTNEVFVMGRAEDIKLVESLVRAIDTDPLPVFR